MKKLLITLVSTFIISVSLYSQAINYDIKVKYNKTESGQSGDITITVKEGDSPFTFYLMTNDPLKGEVLIKSEPTDLKIFTFSGVNPGKYFVKVEDRNGLPAGRTVEISTNEN
jgi:hypothetical protein